MFTLLLPGYARAQFSILIQWLQLIIGNRPHHENLESLTINDIRNGIFAVDNLHNHYFDPRDVVVLKVCRSFLESDHH